MEYKLKTSKDELYNKGFRYNKLMSEEGSDFFTLRFPVLKYKKTTTLECEMSVELQTGDIVMNIFNSGTNDIYAPYYNRKYGEYETIDSIDRSIELQLKRIGAKEVKK